MKHNIDLVKYIFGSNTYILVNPGKDTLSSLAQILQNTKVKIPLTFAVI